jgi:hypothetical protein
VAPTLGGAISAQAKMTGEYLTGQTQQVLTGGLEPSMAEAFGLTE